MKKDWHKTQNNEYLDLLFKRLKQDKLIWVKQFTSIINDFLLEKPYKKISINEIGSNVGHFFRAIPDIKAEIDYNGFDVSEIYLTIARHFFNTNLFYYSDISNTIPRKADVTVISATLEHIEEHENAIKNILESTNELVILRTFIGEEYLEEYCKKDGADEPYLIKQFTLYILEKHFNKFVWDMEIVEDQATNGMAKNVCNESNISRIQKILIFKRR